MVGVNVLAASAVLKNCLAPLIKVHAMPDEPCFTAFDTGALTKFFADHILAQFHLFRYVLLVDREMINTDVEKLVEVPWIPVFHGMVQTGARWTACRFHATSDQALKPIFIPTKTYQAIETLICES